MLLNGEGALDLNQMLSQVARNVVLCMVASESHVVCIDKVRTATLPTGLLLAGVMAVHIESERSEPLKANDRDRIIGESNMICRQTPSFCKRTGVQSVAGVHNLSLLVWLFTCSFRVCRRLCQRNCRRDCNPSNAAMLSVAKCEGGTTRN